MMYKILIVEDSKDVFDQYTQAIEDLEATEVFTLKNAKHRFEAEQYLNEEPFSAVIMDLKIPLDSTDRNPNHLNGKNLLQETLSTAIFPVIVASATPVVLEGEDNLPSKLLTFTKDSGYNNKVIKHLLELQGLLKILPDLEKSQKGFNKDFIETFWNLYGHWDEFKEKFQDVAGVPQVMKRHISNYLVEKWAADEKYGDLHYSEFYLHPPVRDKFYTGDIIEYEDAIWIISTPPCDMEREYPTNIVLLKCEYIKHDNESLNKINSFKKAGEIEANRATTQKKVSELFTKQKDSEHILPPFHGSESSFIKVNFKEIMTISSEKLDNINKKSTLNSYFLPNLLQRYGSYISRLGQPVVCPKDFLRYLITCIPEDKRSS